ncbi:RNA polymerase recycling motor ATPase HelR [Microbacterium saperdae]|uniref:DNA helicase IV n=1 Tax=Microbacterium saperdae TaxID=69368 RepID=A0A543BLJ4_9MICO|nr:RNA polymerase recycling motor ATPase HelR [Microbacterium saperdae]TQL85678.1 DNA helicase IV [Microbacterium saperdae]GGM53834.1 DNA helicase [Microbacterium saperdae]
MPTTFLDPFQLPPSSHRKTASALIEADRAQFLRIADALRAQREETEARLLTARQTHAGTGSTAVDRDLEIRRLSSRLRLLDRFGLDLCLGRMTPSDGSPPLYIGRSGLAADDGTRLLIDWRTPAAEPYFAATMEDPRGISSRRRYRWSDGRISDYWDEALTEDGFGDPDALDDQSSFIASLGSDRSSRMRDVLSTIQSDQDAIIRTPSPGALVVDGGPGTGKTVVALHRAAHLLYAEPRLTHGGGGMLLVGPNAQYLSYVEDVLPSLGEDSVRLSTLRDLVPEGHDAVSETDPRVARLKEALDPGALIEAATSASEQPPQRALRLESPWADLWLSSEEWAEAFSAPDPSSTHNAARDEVWEELLEMLTDQIHDEDVPPHAVRRWLRQDEELTGTFVRAWPLLSPTAIVRRLWSDSEFLGRCAPALTAAEIALLHREADTAWTDADLPLLDAAHRRIGDPEATRAEHRRQAVIASAQEQMSHVVDHLIEDDDSEMKVMSILKGQDARNVLIGVDTPPVSAPDELAGPFAHIVVDEAQELSDAEWRMLLARCPSRSLTVVGDRAQARHGFTESWVERLERIGLRDVRIAHLGVNYRTPSEVMAVAAPGIRAAIPDANVPASVRDSGIPVRVTTASALSEILAEWLSTHTQGIACVIGDSSFAPTPRVRSLTPAGAKGLEFDLVMLVRPEQFGDGVTGAVDRYVAMTRATQELVILR